MSRGADVKLKVTNGPAGRRSPPETTPRRYRFGPFQLDAACGELTRDNVVTVLTPTVASLLAYLAQNPRRLVTKDELLEAIWPGRIVEEANIKQTVFTLRRVLGDDGGRLIVTAPGRGYRFDAVVEREDDDGGDVAADPSTPPAGEPHAGLEAFPVRRRFRFGVAVSLAAVAIALAIGGGFMWLRHRPPAQTPAIVLADFDNATHEAVFDHALGNLLRVDLSQSPYLSVLPDQQAQDTLDQMGRPKDAAVTASVAREICTRTNSDEVVSGKISAVGSHYLLILSASDCSGRHMIAEETVEVARREDIIGQLDRLTSRMRGKLGESLGSIDRFSTPMIATRSSSLEAVEAYSEGVWLNNHGRPDAAVAPLQRAVALDPQLAAAYFSLAAIYNNLLQTKLADEAVLRAYALRDRLNERQRLNAEVYYNKIHTGDYSAILRALQEATAIYPLEWSYWANLANVENDLGNYEAGAAAAERSVALNPPSELPYLALAVADLARGDEIGARKACDLAQKRGLASAMIHAALLDEAMLAGDAAGVRAQEAWATSQPDDMVFLTVEARMAYRAGEKSRGDALFRHIADLSGAGPGGDPNLGFRARLLGELGFTEDAKQLLAQAVGQDHDPEFVLALAQFGDPARARRLLEQQLIQSPQNTLLRIDEAPKVRAILAMRQGDEPAAVKALTPALTYEARGFDVPFLLGKAYLAEGDAARAEAAFRTIVNHPGWYPESPYFALAQLWLARSLALEGKAQATRAAYKQFLESWRNADPQIPLLRQARAESEGGKPFSGARLD